MWCAVGGGKQKTLSVTLSYIEIIILDVNCVLKNLRGGKSQSRKGIKGDIGLYSFIK